MQSIKFYGIENENKETSHNSEIEQTTLKESAKHFENTYSLMSNEKYEVNQYQYETDRYGRIKQVKGSLRLEKGKTNQTHQTKAGGEDRLEVDDGGHLIARRFGGSEKIDNIISMDSHLNRGEYKVLENKWANEIGKGNIVDVEIRCKYSNNSSRPDEIIVKYKVTDELGYTRSDIHRLKN